MTKIRPRTTAEVIREAETHLRVPPEVIAPVESRHEEALAVLSSWTNEELQDRAEIVSNILIRRRRFALPPTGHQTPSAVTVTIDKSILPPLDLDPSGRSISSLLTKDLAELTRQTSAYLSARRRLEHETMRRAVNGEPPLSRDEMVEIANRPRSYVQPQPLTAPPRTIPAPQGATSGSDPITPYAADTVADSAKSTGPEPYDDAKHRAEAWAKHRQKKEERLAEEYEKILRKRGLLAYIDDEQ